jgi:urease beta subunit
LVRQIYSESYKYDLHQVVAHEKFFRSKKVLHLIQKFIKTDALVELGSMHGVFLEVAKEEGISILGLEINHNANQIALSKNLNSLELSAEAFALNKINFEFDCLVMIHTLEHLKNPVDFLKKVFVNYPNLIYIVVVVPNFNSFSRKIVGKIWGSIQIGTHYHHFSQKSLRYLFESNKYHQVYSTTRSGDFNLVAATIVNFFKIDLKRINIVSWKRKILIHIFSKLLNTVYYFGNDEIISIFSRTKVNYNYSRDKS